MHASHPGAEGAPGDSLPARSGPAVEAPSFGSELRRLRLRAGLSQEMLAQRAGLSTAGTAAVRAKPTSSSVREHPGIVGHGTRAGAIQWEALMAEATEAGQDPSAARRIGQQAQRRSRGCSCHGPRQDSLAGSPTSAVAARLDPSRSSVRVLSLIGSGWRGQDAPDLGSRRRARRCLPRWRLVRRPQLSPRLPIGSGGDRAGPAHRRGGWLEKAWLILRQLRDRQFLLVLDNLEQLLGAAPLLAEVVANCPKVALLGTPRVPLRIRAEQRYVVNPLALPSRGASFESIAEAPSVRVRIEHRIGASDFHVDTDSAGAGRGRGQRRLDGISLAIEFAAARVVAGLLYFVGLGGASLLVPGTVNAAVQYAQLGSNLWGVAFLVGSVSLIAVTTIDSLPVLLRLIKCPSARSTQRSSTCERRKYCPREPWQ